jgi:hypothetical protein
MHVGIPGMDTCNWETSHNTQWCVTLANTDLSQSCDTRRDLDVPQTAGLCKFKLVFELPRQRTLLLEIVPYWILALQPFSSVLQQTGALVNRFATQRECFKTLRVDVV